MFSLCLKRFESVIQFEWTKYPVDVLAWEIEESGVSDRVHSYS